MWHRVNAKNVLKSWVTFGGLLGRLDAIFTMQGFLGITNVPY